MSMGKEFIGLVVATHGHRSFVQSPDGGLLEAVRRGRKKDVVVGDKVKCLQTSAEQAAIESIFPRKSLLYRSSEFQTKPLASNIDQVALVFASRPTFNPQFVWKAMLAAETADISLIVIRNKTDYAEDEPAVRPFIDQLKNLGVKVVETSVTHDPQGTKTILQPLFEHKVTLLMGQSGMGKSTILNLLVADANQRTREYSTALNLGKQTTTSTHRFPYGEDGAIVDSPGFQEFGLAHLTVNDLMRGMPEISTRVEDCRFVNCRHMEEPGCAVKKAVETGEIDPARYAFYREIFGQISK